MMLSWANINMFDFRQRLLSGSYRYIIKSRESKCPSDLYASEHTMMLDICIVLCRCFPCILDLGQKWD